MSVTLADGVVLTVEVGFSTSAGAGTVPLGSTLSSITWTDVSAYVREVETSRGRSNELDDFQAGTARVVLSNADRRFDPEHSAGPYYGALTPMRPIRISAQYGAGATTRLFLGFVDAWPQSYVWNFDSVVTVTATDAFKALNLIDLPSYYRYAIAADGATCWLRFDESSTATTAADTITGATVGSWLTLSGSGSATNRSTSGLLVNDGSKAYELDGTSYLRLPEQKIQQWPDASGTRKVTVELWMQSSTTTPGNYAIFRKGNYEFILALGMVVDSSGVGTIQGQVGSVAGVNSVDIYTSAVKVNDGRPHHVVLSVDGNTGSEKLTVDGVVVTARDGATVSGVVYVDNNIRIGDPFSQYSSSSYNFPSPFVGVVDEFAIYDGVQLTDAQAQAHYAIGTGTYATGSTTSARASSLLSMISWMSDGSNLDTGAGTVGWIDTYGKTALAALKECEAAEQGKLFVGVDGKVRFIARQSLSTNTTYSTSQRTYGDGAGELPYSSFRSSYDERLIYNRVNASREGGVEYVVNDSTSQNRYFIRSNDVSNLIVDTDQQIVDIANVRLNTYKAPAYRIEEITVNARANPASLYPAVIGDEIGTRVTVKRRPQSVGSAISKELLIEGIAHRVTWDGWDTTYRLSPAPTVYFILDSATFGVLDVNVLGY